MKDAIKLFIQATIAAVFLFAIGLKLVEPETTAPIPKARTLARLESECSFFGTMAKFKDKEEGIQHYMECNKRVRTEENDFTSVVQE